MLKRDYILSLCASLAISIISVTLPVLAEWFAAKEALSDSMLDAAYSAFLVVTAPVRWLLGIFTERGHFYSAHSLGPSFLMDLSLFIAVSSLFWMSIMISVRYIYLFSSKRREE